MRQTINIVLVVIMSFILSSTRFFNTNVYDVTTGRDYNLKYQIRPTTDSFLKTDSPWSSIDFTPVEYDMSCLISRDRWMSNNLVDESNKKIIWSRVYEYDHNNCPPQVLPSIYEQVNIMVSDNPMAGYPSYTNFKEESTYISDLGIPVWLDYDNENFTNHGKMYTYKKYKYSFIIDQHYFFMDTVTMNSDWPIQYLLDTVDHVYEQINQST
jgi:hypothetical protein